MTELLTFVSSFSSNRMSSSKKLVNNWVFTVSRWLGLLPFDVDGNLKNSLALRFQFQIFILAGAGAIFRIYDMISNDSIWVNKRKIIKNILAGSIQITVIVPPVVQTYVYLKRWKRFFESILQVQNPFQATECRDVFAVACIAVLDISLLICNENGAIRWNAQFFLFHCLLLLSTANYFIAAQFASIVVALAAKLTSSKRIVELRRTVPKNYFEIMELARTVNSAFAIQILFIVCKAFAYCVTYSYFLFVELGEKRCLVGTFSYYCALLVSFIIMDFVMVAYIASSCEVYNRSVSSWDL